MVNYNESKIYKIVSNVGNLIYIGSTTKKYLSTRLAQHKNNYKAYKKGTMRKTTSYQLFDEYEPDNCEIILIENVNCNSKNELHARERYYIESFDCVNKCIPNRTDKERYQENKEHILEQCKVYYEDNKEQISGKKKGWYQENKEQILQKQNEYNEKNKDKFNEKNSCECGGKYTNTNKLHHLKSQKHINYIKSIDQIPDQIPPELELII